MISGVVLAAGEGRRFGGTKQLALLEGRPLVLHAVETLRDAGLDEIVVVTGHDAEAVEAVLPPDVRAVRNPAYRDGQSTSLGAALHALGDDSEAAVILVADQPGVAAADLRALIDGFRRTRQAIVRLRYDDGPGPALLSREIYAEAGHLHGDTGARVLMASHPEWVAEVTVAGPSPRDVDEPGDLPAYSGGEEVVDPDHG
ncbi:MAG: nucleotidyltransferase family protein [Actinomycetota bacterium]